MSTSIDSGSLLALVAICCLPFAAGAGATLAGFWAAHKMASKHKGLGAPEQRFRPPQSGQAGIYTAISLVLIVLIALLVAGYSSWYHGTAATVTVRVNDKQTHCTNSGSSNDCKYLIYTDNTDGSTGEIFEDTDDLWFGKYNSSDVYNQLKVGRTYKLTVAGWRSQFWSSYRDIESVQAAS